MKRTIALIILIMSLCLVARAQQATTYIGCSSKVLKDSLFIPWEIIYGPDDHIWFTQKNGFIFRMDTAGIHTDTLYHEPMTVTIKESGMLGMALHPNFTTQPYLYVVFEYLNPAGDIRERIERLTYSVTSNLLSSPLILLDSIRGYLYHNGCRLMTVDDKLFISIADATDTTIPQNLNVINGKILRINLDGSIPADNPITGSPIWTWGHRNPQGFVYANNIFYSSEHGPNTDDEVNIIQKGRDYGWPYVRGYCDEPWETTFCADSNVVQPLHAWTPTIAPCGIDYYHHTMFPTLQNSLLLTTLKDKHLYQLALNETYDSIISIAIIDSVNFGRLRDICISPDGKIFLSTSNSDPNYTGHKIDRIIQLYNPTPGRAMSSVIFYPNPSTDVVYFSIPVTFKQLHFVLTDIAGRKTMEGTQNAGRPRISVKALSAGVYHIVIETDTGIKYIGNIVRG